MAKKFEPLTSEELKEIERRRAKARSRARELVHNITDDVDAALIAAAEADPDNPPITDEEWRQMRPAHLVHPELIAARLRRERGRPKSVAPKQQVTLRIDRDVLEKYRATGDGWQSRINAALRKAAKV